MYSATFHTNGLLRVRHSGIVRTISGQFKKSDLCVEHRLNVRVIGSVMMRFPKLTLSHTLAS